MSNLTVEDYHIGWICALPVELTAATSMRDGIHESISGTPFLQDKNNYAFGRIHNHNVVFACMAAGVDGLVNAATVANDMARTFPALRVCLLVGIGGGIPNLEKGIDLRLGDVVVSQPDGTWGGVVQYDKGKAETGGDFVIKGQLNQPPQALLQTLPRLRAEHDQRDSWVPFYMKEALERYPKMAKRGYVLPLDSPDHLYCPECDQNIETLAGVDCMAIRSHKIRPKRDGDTGPAIHYGIIASANQVVKDAALRDKLRGRFGALCVEMEAAGLMNHVPCLVIRGICDYADSHKNDAWQPYAAMTAAAYAKELLYYVSPAQASLEQPMQQVIELLEEIKGQFKQTQVQHESEEHRQCHQAFKTSSYEEHKDFNPPRLAGTCQWVLKNPIYQEWHQSSNNTLLWISADPGCGKSVLARSLIDAELQCTDTHTVCYFFFKDNQEQDNIATAFCAILHQLFSSRPRLIQHAMNAWRKNGQKLQSETSELWRIWMDATTSDPEAGDVTCVLDALDECKENDRRTLISYLTDFYTRTSTCSRIATTSHQGRGRLKFLVTSRPYDEIHRSFTDIPSHLPSIRLRGEDENDLISTEINLVIKYKVAQLAATLKLKTQTACFIENELLNMKHRTYLWLHLALGDIYHNYRKSFRRDQEVIRSIPSTVDGAYNKILSRIDTEDELTVKQILQIIVGARRPLSISEMAIALGLALSSPSSTNPNTSPQSLATVMVDQDDLGDRIRDWCGLFVYVNHSRIYLIHQTAKEFLVHTGGAPAATMFQSGWKHCLKLTEIERIMLRICVNFLCFEEVSSTAKSLLRRLNGITYLNLDENDDGVESLFVYCAQYWPSHLLDFDLSTEEDILVMRRILLKLYDTTSDLYKQWFSIFLHISPLPARSLVSQMNRIRLAALLGHNGVLEMIFTEPGSDVNQKDGTGSTALILASRFGHEKVVQLLLKAGADVDWRDHFNGTALQAACRYGHKRVVQLLLEAGASIDLVGDIINPATALQEASRAGHRQVVQLLLEAGANVNIQGTLQSACRQGSEEVVQLLLKAGADVNLEEYCDTSLQYACDFGHVKVVKLLLEAGANPNVGKDAFESGLDSYWDSLHNTGLDTALWLASSKGHAGVVELLLKAGADPDFGVENPPLFVASERGYEEIVKMLLEAGANVDMIDVDENTALQVACKEDNDNEEAIRLLLDAGANPNARAVHSNYGTPLQEAAALGWASVVQMLLKAGAYVNAEGGTEGTALQRAAKANFSYAKDSVETVRLLLDSGADVNATGFHGTALEEASRCGHESVAQLLLDSGADVNSALHIASKDGSTGMVRLLLNAGANVNAEIDKKGTPLQSVAWCTQWKSLDCIPVAQLLLAAGADVNATGTEYIDTALQEASKSGHKALMQLLLDSGADVNATGYHGTALQLASQHGHGEGVLLLLAAVAAQLDSEDKDTRIIEAFIGEDI